MEPNATPANPGPAPTGRSIPTDNNINISACLHCKICLTEMMAGNPAAIGESPESYSRLTVGWTPIGLQVWCHRHDVNVMHVDFQGAKHPANLTRPKTDQERRDGL